MSCCQLYHDPTSFLVNTAEDILIAKKYAVSISNQRKITDWVCTQLGYECLTCI